MSRKGMAILNKNGEYLSIKSTEKIAIWTSDISKAMIWTIQEAMMEYIQAKRIKDYNIVNITTTVEITPEKNTISGIYK